MVKVSVILATRKLKRVSANNLLEKVDSYLEADDFSVRQLSVYTGLLKDIRQQLTDLNSSIQETLTDETELEADLVESMTLEKQIVERLSELNFALEQLTQPAAEMPTQAPLVESTHHADLPKLPMVKFSGSPLHWDEF